MESLIQQTYDSFYAKHYDTLFNNDKYRWESMEILRRIGQNRSVHILDLGCGTGVHYSLLCKHYLVTGLDISASMLRVARERNPDGKFVCGDMRDGALFDAGTFTHAICMYAAILYNEHLEPIFDNLRKWLRPDGVACISVLDPKLLEAGPVRKSLSLAHGAVTRYPGFDYLSEWQRGADNIVIYREEFVFEDNRVVRHHRFFMPTVEEVVDLARRHGFILKEQVSLSPVDCSDESLLFLVAHP